MKFPSFPSLPRPALLLLLAGLLALAVPRVQAQSDARGVPSMSTAGGGPAFVRSTEALFLNPANLGLDDRPGRLILSLGSARVFSGGDLLQFGAYNEHFTDGAFVSDSTIRGALDDVFGADDVMRTAGMQADLVPLAATYRTASWAIGLGIRTRAYSKMDLNRGLFDLALLGTDRDRTLPVNATFQAVSTTELSVGASYHLLGGRLSVGVAPKYVLGTDYAEGRLRSTMQIADGTLTHRFAYTTRTAGGLTRDVLDQFDLFERSPFWNGNPLKNAEFRAPFSGFAGSGIGLDLGTTFAVTNHLQVAASLTDLGSIQWSKNADVVTPADSVFRFDGFELDRSRIQNEFGGSVSDYVLHVADSLVRDSYGQMHRAEGSFNTPLPAALHLGTTWQPTASLTLNGGTSVALNDAVGNLSRAPSLHAGLEYVLGGRYALPLRTGVRVAGGGALTLGLGLGFYTPVYDINLGISITPHSELMGRGGRYAFALSLGNLRF